MTYRRNFLLRHFGMWLTPQMRDRALERGLKQSSIVSSGIYAARATASGTPAFAFKTGSTGSSATATSPRW
jgi:hypothetical protein